MLQNTTNLLFILMAGLINASFVIPVRYVSNTLNGKIWMSHSIIGLGIIPWVILSLFFPNTLLNYSSLDTSVFLILVTGGLIFGLGQVCFIYAIGYIGIALSFAINLSIGVTVGSMYSIFYQGTFFKFPGFLVTLATLFILFSLLIYYRAGNEAKNKQILNDKPSRLYRRGWVLACLAGLASGLQNITFLTTAFYYKDAQNLFNNSFWVWPPFLLAAIVPMLIGFAYKFKGKLSSSHSSSYKELLTSKNLFLITLMGLFFTGSLALYSFGMSQLTRQQQVVGWPIFMISIILTSQMWGWIYKESAMTTMKGKLYSCLSVILLIVAIIILAINV